ncbi:hypothetical protein VCHC22A1_0235, partial [Vibrio cholerae HC-22A1]
MIALLGALALKL